MTNTKKPTTQADIYTTAEKAVYIALKARHEKSGLQFLTDLQNAQYTDKLCRTAPQIAEQIAELEELHESHRKGYEFYNARANRLTLTEYERALCYTLSKDFQNKSDHENKQLADLYQALNNTYTDRADLTQTACLQIIENEKNPAPITATVLATYGATTIEELTAEELATAQASANFRTVINAVGRAINKLASPEALNSTKTVLEQITKAEYRNYIYKYGILNDNNDLTIEGVKIPHTTKQTRASDCYITIEERNTAKHKGYFKVYHYRTVAPYQYIEDFNTTEDGENDINYIKTYNPFISTYGDIERIEELTHRANLTDRQRLFLEHFARRCRVSADFKDCKNYAFSKIGITTESNKTTFFNRLKKALTTTK